LFCGGLGSYWFLFPSKLKPCITNKNKQLTVIKNGQANIALNTIINIDRIVLSIG